MSSNPDFIDHYINQIINEECIIELTNLSHSYKNEMKKINNPNRKIGDDRYMELFGRENPNSVQNELKALDIKYKAEAKEIAVKHGKQEGISVVEWIDKKTREQIEKDSLKTKDHINECQENMLDKIAQSKEKELAKKIQKTENHINERQEAALEKIEKSKEQQEKERAEQKAKIVEGMTKGSSMSKQFNQELNQDTLSQDAKVTYNNPEQKDLAPKEEELTREQRHAKLVEEMKQRGQEMTKKHEPGM